jgi:hypothetical protein
MRCSLHVSQYSHSVRYSNQNSNKDYSGNTVRPILGRCPTQYLKE